jgi:hypothetical protein
MSTDTATVTPTVRPLSEIARDITKHWVDRNNRPCVYFGAVPYLAAMRNCDDISASYGCDSAASIVNYFLSNAATWRGEHARRIKAELKQLVKGRW